MFANVTSAFDYYQNTSSSYESTVTEDFDAQTSLSDGGNLTALLLPSTSSSLLFPSTSYSPTFAAGPSLFRASMLPPTPELLSTSLTSSVGSFVDDETPCNVLSSDCDCHDLYQYYDYSDNILLGLVALPIICFGLGADLISTRIFTHRLMISSSINWYLAVLSSSDTLILFSAFFVLVLPRIGEFCECWWATSSSYWLSPYMYGLMVLSQTVSVWMTTGMSVHRYIGVCAPFHAASLLSVRRVRAFIASLIAFSLLFNTSRFFEVRIVNNCFRTNIEWFIPVLAPSALRLNETYRLIFFGWAYTILMFVVPFALLITLNSQVLLAIRRSNRLHQHSIGNGGATADSGARRAERKERQTSIMLIAIVLVFLACNTLAFVVNILENVGYADNENSIYFSLVTFNNFLVIVNASCNIFIYMLFSEKYRLLLRHYLFCDWSREGEMLLSTTYA